MSQASGNPLLFYSWLEGGGQGTSVILWMSIRGKRSHGVLPPNRSTSSLENPVSRLQVICATIFITIQVFQSEFHVPATKEPFRGDSLRI